MFDHQSVVVPKPAPASNYVLVRDRHRLNLGALGDVPGDRPDPGGTEGIGGHTTHGYVYGFSGREGGVERGAILRLHPYYANRSLQGRGHSGHEPAATDGEHDYIKRPWDLLDKFQADRSLAGAHLYLVVGVANEAPVRSASTNMASWASWYRWPTCTTSAPRAFSLPTLNAGALAGKKIRDVVPA